MTRKVERFWQALERVPDLAAVPGEWREQLGDDYAHTSRLLLPTSRVAGSMRCTAPGRTCVHEIRPWKRRFLSICPDGCEPAELTRDEVTIHRLDVVTLGREIVEALGLDVVRAEPVPDVADVWHVGAFVPFCGFRFPAFLALAGEPEALRSVADSLVARGRPFVLLAPTRSAFVQVIADVVRQAKACFLPLDDLLGHGNDERLTLLDGVTAEGVLAAFRAAHIPEAENDDGKVFFPTPPGVKWDDVAILFKKDAHTVSVTVGNVQGVLNYTQMGMASRKDGDPNNQWDLLYQFALGNGRLTWQNRSPAGKHRKQKELLAKALRRFFRIDGDPFIVAGGGGWNARFTITCDGNGL